MNGLQKENGSKGFRVSAEAKADSTKNILDFPSKLEAIRSFPLNRHDANDKMSGGLPARCGSEDEAWKFFAEILDQTAPDWSYSVSRIHELKSVLTVTSVIEIDGVTREGIGFSPIGGPDAVRSAERGSFIDAARKFGVDRDACSVPTVADHSVPKPNRPEFPDDPMAKSLMELISSKQLRLINFLGEAKTINPAAECERIFGCDVGELSRKSAAWLIKHLEGLDFSNNMLKAC